MADVPDERLVAGLRHLVGDLHGGEKFGARRDTMPSEFKDLRGDEHQFRRCYVCQQPFSCHSGWDCPPQSHIDKHCAGKSYWLKRERLKHKQEGTTA